MEVGQAGDPHELIGEDNEEDEQEDELRDPQR
jgi:hypothetical protein